MTEVKKLEGKIADLTGRSFGRLTAVNMKRNSRGVVAWDCICTCGNTKNIIPSSLIQGKSKSCGCLKKEVTSERFTTHGMSSSIEYRHYANMLSRCTNKNHPDYEHYSSRGIKVCQEFIDNFLVFLKEIGLKPKGKWSVGRIDNRLGYQLGNIRWETDEQQARNHSLQSNNKTGVVGVLLRTTEQDGSRFIARYNDENGKRQSKSFSILKHGYDEALTLAKEWRESAMKNLQTKGVYYGEHHGVADE